MNFSFTSKHFFFSNKNSIFSRLKVKFFSPNIYLILIHPTSIYILGALLLLSNFFSFIHCLINFKKRARFLIALNQQSLHGTKNCSRTYHWMKKYIPRILPETLSSSLTVTTLVKSNSTILAKVHMT